ncbi:MAG: hypothetical protein ACPG77_00115 [Nannocystaceae bacterium]
MQQPSSTPVVRLSANPRDKDAHAQKVARAAGRVLMGPALVVLCLLASAGETPLILVGTCLALTSVFLVVGTR